MGVGTGRVVDSGRHPGERGRDVAARSFELGAASERS